MIEASPRPSLNPARRPGTALYQAPSPPVKAPFPTLIVLGMVAACAHIAADAPRPAPRTKVLFGQPEDYAEFSLIGGEDWERDAVLSTMRNFIVKLADRRLPAGFSLKITFTEMELSDSGYRVVGGGMATKGRDLPALIVPIPRSPVLKFTFSVRDASGTVVRQGTADLRNADFGAASTTRTSDSLRFEKAMLSGWASEALRDLKPAPAPAQGRMMG